VSPPRLIQLIGLLIVTFVMIRSYVVSDMAFQFGGLGVGAAVFPARPPARESARRAEDSVRAVTRQSAAARIRRVLPSSPALFVLRGAAARARR
jgi:hypothetical protein